MEGRACQALCLGTPWPEAGLGPAGDRARLQGRQGAWMHLPQACAFP